MKLNMLNQFSLELFATDKDYCQNKNDFENSRFLLALEKILPQLSSFKLTFQCKISK